MQQQRQAAFSPLTTGRAADNNAATGTRQQHAGKTPLKRKLYYTVLRSVKWSTTKQKETGLFIIMAEMNISYRV